jgi:hypothetical protein
VTVVRPAVHFAACDDVYAGNFLLKNRCLTGALLRIIEITRR